MRKIVIVTLSIPVALFVAYSVFSSYYSPDAIPAEYEFDARETEITAADGARLAATAVRVDAKHEIRPVVIQIAERSLDRDWNSRSFSFRTGERLGSILGGAGYHNLRFDHRGTGDTSASPRTRLDLDLMAADVLSVARDGRKRFKPATIRVEASNTPPQNRATSLFLLAHDSGCALTLRAIKNDLIKNPAIDGSKGARRDALPTGVILLACDLSGALLDQWGRQLLYNMRRQNVDPDIVTRAEGEWSRFRKDGSLPLKEIAATEKPPPDLVAFREALRFMASEEMRDFRATAAAIDLEGSARTLLRRGIPVLHLIGTMDAELPPESIQAMRSLAASLAKTGPYRFHLIPAMNHFLKEQQQDLRGPGLALERMNPFRIIHPTAIRLIREFIETHSRNL